LPRCGKPLYRLACACGVMSAHNRRYTMKAKIDWLKYCNWSTAPLWAKWWAVDADGTSFWFEKMPIIEGNFWGNDGHAVPNVRLVDRVYIEKWKSSQKKRPEANPEPAKPAKPAVLMASDMTMRDAFAMAALIGKMEASLQSVEGANVKGMTVGQHIAQQSYLMADAMMAERDKS
jgi:hypothetical protein